MNSDRARSRVAPPSEIRLYRLGRRVTLNEACVFAGISLARASQIERFPEEAAPEEIEQLRAGIDIAASRRDSEDSRR